MALHQPVRFEDAHIGDTIPERQYGPLTIIDTVRWAGLQENSQQLHFDRDHVRQHNGLKTFIASGAYRQALLMRMLTDWIGPMGRLRKIAVRQTHSTFEGDLMRFGARIVDKSADPTDPWIDCELLGINHDDKQILTGRCRLMLPRRERGVRPMEEKVSFQSDGLKIAGLVDTPAEYKTGERRPAFITLHGFGGNKDGQGQKIVAKQLSQWGYISLRLDFRGCGESEGERGRIICLDQVADTRNAISYLGTRPEVDPARIALIGSSFGAAVAVFTGGADSRVAAVISCGGWGDGERKFRGQHPGAEKWAKFTAMLEEGKRHREQTGKSLMVPRYDIVPIPEKLRNRMSGGSIMEFPAETAQSMNDFRADDQVGNISPRPLLLIHSANDSVTPTYESIEMFKKARQPAELHLLSDVDHFTFNEENPRLTNIVHEWLGRYFPVQNK